MKTTKELDGYTCDKCGAFDTYAPYICVYCGKDYCYECGKVVGKTYSHGIYASGSGDGFYCHPCDGECKDELHTAYQLIESLRNEAKGWGDAFAVRREAAEKRCEELADAKGVR